MPVHCCPQELRAKIRLLREAMTSRQTMLPTPDTPPACVGDLQPGEVEDLLCIVSLFLPSDSLFFFFILSHFFFLLLCLLPLPPPPPSPPPSSSSFIIFCCSAPNVVQRFYGVQWHFLDLDDPPPLSLHSCLSILIWMPTSNSNAQ